MTQSNVNNNTLLETLSRERVVSIQYYLSTFNLNIIIIITSTCNCKAVPVSIFQWQRLNRATNEVKGILSGMKYSEN